MTRSNRDGQELHIGACSCCPPVPQPMRGMWHDPNGIIYPYDDEDRRIIAAAQRAHEAQRNEDTERE